MIRIVSFNTLADVCADNSQRGFPEVEPSILEWDYRSRLIQKKIEKWCSEKYIILLQEVDKIEWYRELLLSLQYEAIHNEDLKRLHNCMICYPKGSKVEHLAKGNYPSYSQEYIAVKIDEITVCTTHCKAKKPFTKDRLVQISHLLSILPSDKVIVAGDFNESSTDIGTSLSEMKSSGFFNAHVNMKHTTCKKRDVVISHKIDWIWYKGLSLATSTTELDDLPLLPNYHHPSDHVAISAIFTY